MVHDQMSWTQNRSPHPRIRSVPYRIHSCSSFSKEFVPSRIIPSRPEDHTSRWSCQTGDTAPWILLELNKPAVLRTDEITIGRYQDEHPCNAQSITVLAGISSTQLEEVLNANLKNDGQGEKKALRHRARMWMGNMERVNPWDIRRERNTMPSPVKYVKILPGRAYEPRYNVSLWHIKLEGISDEAYMQTVQKDWYNSQRLQQDRMVLKHLRYSRDLRSAFEHMLSLMQQTHGISTILEHPLVTELFDRLVVQRNYTASEETVQRICEDGMMREFPAIFPKGYAWTIIGDSSFEKPSARGGHAICAYNGTYWLFGGYDGRSNLDDFWRGSLEGDILSWTRMERNSELCPDFRSRYRMVATDSHVYMIGVAAPADSGIPVNASFGLVVQDLVNVVSSTDASSRADTTAHTPFWEYAIASNRWRQLAGLDLSGSRETVTSLEWTSGRLLIGKASRGMHSFATYDLQEDKWMTSDSYTSAAASLSNVSRKSSDCELAYFFKSACLPDFLFEQAFYTECFDAVNGRHVIVSRSAVPEPSTSELGGQNLTIERISPPNESATATSSSRLFANLDGLSLTMIEGNNGECIIPSTQKPTSVYAFSVVRGEWKQLEMTDALYPDLGDTLIEQLHADANVQCGHEMVYDRISGRCIFFGGRTDASTTVKENAAVELVLYSVTEADLLRKCRRLIRRQAFLEILRLGSSLEALEFLQSALVAVTDPLDPDEQRDLKALFTELVRQREHQLEDTDSGLTSKDVSHLEAFAEILCYVAARYKEPNGEIVCNMES